MSNPCSPWGSGYDADDSRDGYDPDDVRDPEVVAAELQADITCVGDELRTADELAGVDLDEYRRLIARMGMALVPAFIGGEAGWKVVAS